MTRICDLAAATLQRVSGERFGINSRLDRQSREERDAAVARARRWLVDNTDYLNADR